MAEEGQEDPFKFSILEGQDPDSQLMNAMMRVFQQRSASFPANGVGRNKSGGSRRCRFIRVAPGVLRSLPVSCALLLACVAALSR